MLWISIGDSSSIWPSIRDGSLSPTVLCNSRLEQDGAHVFALCWLIKAVQVSWPLQSGCKELQPNNNKLSWSVLTLEESNSSITILCPQLPPGDNTEEVYHSLLIANCIAKRSDSSSKLSSTPFILLLFATFLSYWMSSRYLIESKAKNIVLLKLLHGSSKTFCCSFWFAGGSMASQILDDGFSARNIFYLDRRSCCCKESFNVKGAGGGSGESTNMGSPDSLKSKWIAW